VIESRVGAALGLESLSVDYLALDQTVSLSAGKRLGSHILLTYTRPVGAAAAVGDAYTVSLSYEIGPRLRLTLEQQKGPLVFGNRAAISAINQTNIVETRLLLEGSIPF
jgi:hypothetical protein